MAIPHVSSGETARASEQNALIDQVNTNTTNISANDGDISGHEGRISTLESTFTVARYENHNGVSIPEGVSIFSYDTVANPSTDVTANWDMSLFTINRDGIYTINAGLRWTDSAGAGARAAFIFLNGDHSMGGALSGADTNPGTAMSDNSVSTSAWLNAGDTIEFGLFQNSGEALNCSGTHINCISIARLGH